MRTKKLTITAMLSLLSLCGALAIAQDAASFLGLWNGSWEGGGGAGRFDLTVERGADGKLSGGVSVGQDTGDYVAKFVTVAIEGGELKARYSYTPDEQADIVLAGKAEGGALSGSWSMVQKGQDTALAQGTWTVKKK